MAEGFKFRGTGAIYNDSEYFMAMTSVGVVMMFWLFCIILFSLEHHFPEFPVISVSYQLSSSNLLFLPKK